MYFFFLLLQYTDSTPFVCPPKIVLLDLKRDGRILISHEFSDDVAAHVSTYLNKIVVDDAYGGYAYITDNSGPDPGIVVYSRRLNRSWKIREPNSMRPSLDAIAFVINGRPLNISIPIDGIALGPYYAAVEGGPTIERNVYYCPLSSYHLYSIPASLLRDPEIATRLTPDQVVAAITDHGVKASQTDGMVMDNHGILYFGLLGENAIAQWDSFQPFTLENQHIIAHDDFHIQWTDGMGFDEEGNLYVVVNRLHNFAAQRLNPNNINFRILRSKTGTLSYVHTGRSLQVPPGTQLLPERSVTIVTNNDLGLTTPGSPLYSSTIFGASTRLPYTSGASMEAFSSSFILLSILGIYRFRSLIFL